MEFHPARATPHQTGIREQMPPRVMVTVTSAAVIQAAERLGG